MNGPASASMRQKGIDYKLNWGVPFIELKRMAASYGKDYDLAIALWKEDIRECKIMATLIMPPEKMDPEVADIWIDGVRSQELAEMMAFNLLQHLPYAPALAYQWIASTDEMRQIAGYQTLARLFMKDEKPNQGGINEFLDQAAAALRGGSLGVRHAAANCVNRFAQLGSGYASIASKALKGLILLD